MYRETAKGRKATKIGSPKVRTRQEERSRKRGCTTEEEPRMDSSRPSTSGDEADQAIPRGHTRSAEAMAAGRREGESADTHLSSRRRRVFSEKARIKKAHGSSAELGNGSPEYNIENSDQSSLRNHKIRRALGGFPFISPIVAEDCIALKAPA